jgi:hypothetical protein
VLNLLKHMGLIVLAFLFAGGLVDNVGPGPTILIVFLAACLYIGWGILIYGSKGKHNVKKSR